MRALASLTCVWFIGYKRHFLVDSKGHIYRYDISCGNANDRDAVKGGLLDAIVAVVFADRGYVGAQLAQGLKRVKNQAHEVCRPPHRFYVVREDGF